MIEIKYPFLDLATVNAPYFEAMTKAASRVIESGRYIGGAEVEAFEREMGALCMMPYAVGVSNGLDALRLILEGYKALGRLKEGDGVIVPANTYVASVLAVTQAGLTPVLVDPDEVTMNLSAKGIEEGLGERTRAVMPVHLYGRVAWNEEMADAAKRHNLIVIEDAAQSIGARSAVKGLHGSDMAGGLGDAAAMSFCPPCSPFTRHHVKNLPMNLLSFPHSSTRLANQYINGTGIILPMTHTINDGILGSPKPTEYGMAPRSSSIGTMDIRNIVRYFFNITILSFNFQVRL